MSCDFNHFHVELLLFSDFDTLLFSGYILPMVEPRNRKYMKKAG